MVRNYLVFLFSRTESALESEEMECITGKFSKLWSVKKHFWPIKCIDRSDHKLFRRGYLAPFSRTRNIVFEACLFWFYGLKKEEYYI